MRLARLSSLALCLWIAVVSLATVHDVDNVTELETALAAVVDGDTIRFTTGGTYTATGAYTITKSITIDANGKNPTIDMGTNNVQITGQAGGTTQTWRGPMIVKSAKTTTTGGSYGVINALCTNGNVAVTFEQVTANGLNGSSVRTRDSGFAALCDNASFTTTFTCRGCTVTGVANQGFLTNLVSVSPSDTATNHSYAVITTYGCVATNCDEEGSSAHEGTSIIDYGATYGTLGEYPACSGQKSTQRMYGGTYTAGADFGGLDGQGFALLTTDNVWSCEDATLTINQPTVDDWAAATAYAPGDFVQSTASSTRPGFLFVARHGAWVASTNYAVGNHVEPTQQGGNGFFYEATADAGSSGTTEPTWPTTAGNTVVDGGITWTCRATRLSHATTEPTWNYSSGAANTDNQVRWVSVSCYAFRVDANGTANTSMTVRRCNINIGANIGLLQANGQCTILFEDCTITQTGDHGNLNSAWCIVSGANANVTFRRCIFNFDGETSTDAANPIRPSYFNNTVTGGTSTLTLEGCVFINSTTAYWDAVDGNGGNSTTINFVDGSYGNIKHCSFFGNSLTRNDVCDILGTPASDADRIVLTGNIFSGFRRGWVYAGAAVDYTTAPTNAWYNVCHNPATANNHFVDAGGAYNPGSYTTVDAQGNTVQDPAYADVTTPTFDLRASGTSVIDRDTANSGYQLEPWTLSLYSGGSAQVPARDPEFGGPFQPPLDAGAYAGSMTITFPSVGHEFFAIGDVSVSKFYDYSSAVLESGDTLTLYSILYSGPSFVQIPLTANVEQAVTWPLKMRRAHISPRDDDVWFNQRSGSQQDYRLDADSAPLLIDTTTYQGKTSYFWCASNAVVDVLLFP